MEQLVVVPYPDPITLKARSIRHASVPDGSLGMAYYYEGRVVARGVVTTDAVATIRSLLESPVSVALAAREDDDGNIDGRLCVVLPVADGQLGSEEGEDAPEEPWKASVPTPPNGFESDYDDGESGEPQFALLPIGNVVRNASDRRHSDVGGDAREMLQNLLVGGGKDAVQKAIDDLLNSI